MRLALVAVAMGLLVSAAGAQERWTLLTADFQRQLVVLKAFDEQGAVVVVGGEEKRVGLDELVQIDRVGVPRQGGGGPFTLHLAGGDRLAGRPAAMETETLTWRSEGLGEVTVSVRQARAITRSAEPAPAAAEPLREDVVTLANGDSVRGIVADIDARVVTIQVGREMVRLPLEQVVKVQFAATSVPAALEGPAMRVRLADGSSLVVRSVGMQGEKTTVTLAEGAQREVESARITGMEQINGSVAWLSTLAPRESVHRPYFGQLLWPARMDRSVAGGPIRLGDEEISRGIGVHSYSRLSWELDGTYSTFRTQYAICANDGNGRHADVTVRIKLDDRVVHEQENVRLGMIPPVVEIDLENARALTLEVDYGETFDVQDRLNWIEPALVRTSE